jgi:hypothetical protein
MIQAPNNSRFLRFSATHNCQGLLIKPYQPPPLRMAVNAAHGPTARRSGQVRSQGRPTPKCSQPRTSFRSPTVLESDKSAFFAQILCKKPFLERFSRRLVRLGLPCGENFTKRLSKGLCVDMAAIALPAFLRFYKYLKSLPGVSLRHGGGIAQNRAWCQGWCSHEAKWS